PSFFFQAEDGIRAFHVTGVQTCALPISVMADHPPQSTDVTYVPDVTFTLRTDIADGKLVYVSEAGATKGQVNPDIRVAEGAVVQINVVNGDGAIHDFAVPAFGANSDEISGKGASSTVVFRADKSGTFEYLCSLPGHKAAGMVGKLIVGNPEEAAASQFPDLSKNPSEVGEPVGKRGPKEVTINLET